MTDIWNKARYLLFQIFVYFNIHNCCVWCSLRTWFEKSYFSDFEIKMIFLQSIAQLDPTVLPACLLKFRSSLLQCAVYLHQNSLLSTTYTVYVWIIGQGFFVKRPQTKLRIARLRYSLVSTRESFSLKILTDNASYCATFSHCLLYLHFYCYIVLYEYISYLYCIIFVLYIKYTLFIQGCW